jgi:hypothetical protein
VDPTADTTTHSATTFGQVMDLRSKMRSASPSLTLFLVAIVLRSASLVIATRVFGLELSGPAAFQDGPSYVSLASTWPLYPYAETTGYFPFYPIVIKLFALFIPSVELAALLVSLLAGSVAVVMYGQVLRSYTESWFEIALVFCVLPFRWFNINQLAMSESLFMLLLLLSVLLTQKNHRVFSGVVLGFSWLTRLSGLLVMPAFLFRSLRSHERARTLLWLVPAFVCLGLLGLYFAVRFHDPLIYSRQNIGLWGGGRFSYPFSAYAAGFLDPGISLIRKPYIAFVIIQYFGGLIVGIVRWRRNRPEWLFWILWALPFLLLQTVLRGKGTNWGFISSARLMMPAAPAILLFWLEGLSRRTLYALFAVLVPLTFLFNMAEFQAQIP